MNIEEMIFSPTLILNEKICRRNISIMAERASRSGVIFRPHFKTHLSIEVGNWFREAGISAITVTSVAMAKEFSDAGWDDITIAFPVNIREIEELNRLSAKVKLNLLAESSEAISFLGRKLSGRAGIFIKIDTGYHRTGIKQQNFSQIEEVLTELERYENLNFKGFLAHAGHTYKAGSNAEVSVIYHESVLALNTLKQKYLKRYPHLFISYGDTPSCSILNDFSEVDEIRPGNFVFYDLMQVNIGSCSYADIAVALACPVVAKHADRQELIIHGGAVHFSREHYFLPDGEPCYGLAVESGNEGWSDPIDKVWISALSQEHGTVKALNQRFFEETEIGDLIYVLPVHSCLTSNLMRGSRITDKQIYF